MRLICLLKLINKTHKQNINKKYKQKHENYIATHNSNREKYFSDCDFVGDLKSETIANERNVTLDIINQVRHYNFPK